jgi:hypothetical protein
MKEAAKMKVKMGKKETEPRKEKKGAKLKEDRTYETNVREKEGNGKKVKSKMNTSK